MRLTARDTLDDCFYAIEALEDGDRYNWKSHWRAAIAGLRAVGHVLENVDSLSSKKHKEVIDAHWQSLNNERDTGHIFWDFIYDARNNLLKKNDGLPNCKVSVMGDENVDIVVLYLELDDGSDGLPMLREAAEWWDDELSEIEKDISE